MAVDSLRLKKFLMFTDEFSVDFISGINVFIGTNATGKSTLLKCIYAACEYGKGRRFQDYFSPKITIDESAEIIVRSGGAEFKYGGSDEAWAETEIKSILIPTAEMLSHSNGLVAMSAKYGIPFNAAQIDILINAQLWETKEISERNRKLLNMINNAIGGDVLYENDTFYVVKNDGLKIEFSLEAEGYRKLGLLWKLIRNGLLESGSVLLWDEPEASINPELIPLIADILYILKNDGVQIFLATHNYMLSKYIDLRKNDSGDVLFISLYKNAGGGIDYSESDSYADLENNPIELSEEHLYNEIVKKSTDS